MPDGGEKSPVSLFVFMCNAKYFAIAFLSFLPTLLQDGLAKAFCMFYKFLSRVHMTQATNALVTILLIVIQEGVASTNTCGNRNIFGICLANYLSI